MKLSKLKSDVKFDELAFNKMKRIMPNLLAVHRKKTHHKDYQVKSLP